MIIQKRTRIRDRFRHVIRSVDHVAETACDEAPKLKKKWLRRFRKTHFGKKIWPAIRHELAVVFKVSGVIFISIWAKRVVEQLFGAKLLNEKIMRGEVNEIIRDVEQQVGMEERS